MKKNAALTMPFRTLIVLAVSGIIIPVLPAQAALTQSVDLPTGRVSVSDRTSDNTRVAQQKIRTAPSQSTSAASESPGNQTVTIPTWRATAGTLRFIGLPARPGSGHTRRQGGGPSLADAPGGSVQSILTWRVTAKTLRFIGSQGRPSRPDPTGPGRLIKPPQRMTR